MSSIHEFFCFDLEKRKENQSSSHARSLPVFCFAQHHCVILPLFPRRFHFARCYSFVSRGICSDVLPSLLLFRGAVPFVISARFYCLQSRNSFVSTLSKRNENQLSAHARSLLAIVLLMCSIVFSAFAKRTWSTRWRFARNFGAIFLLLGPFSLAVSFLKSRKMVAVWKKNTLASLNAQMSHEERHSAHDKFRTVARGNSTKSSCFVGNVRCFLTS